MGKLDKMKQEYDNIFIPEELNVRIQQEIGRSEKRMKSEPKKRLKPKKFFHTIEAAAVLCVVFTATLNLNEVFAKEAAKIPVVGRIAEVLTFRSYETETDDIGISVKIPSVQVIAEETGIEVEGINQEIYDRCQKYADEAVLYAKEYRQAFLSTGGTLEEWEQHNIKITVDYEILQQGEKYLSFVVKGEQNWINSGNEYRYYNLSMETGKMVTLKDLLGDNYKDLVNESIRKQIEKRRAEGEVFFDESEGGFSGISEDVKFYINKENHAVVVFDQYEIAPGAAGRIEFEIMKE